MPINPNPISTLSVSSKRLVAGLQLPLSTCWLLAQRPPDGRDMLVVLHLQVHRVLRHAFLLAAEEESTRLDASRDTSWSDAVQRWVSSHDFVTKQFFNEFHCSVDGNEVCAGRSQHVLRNAKRLCAHCHVLLLYDRRDGSGISEIHLVEEVLDSISNGMWQAQTHTANCKMLIIFDFSHSQLQFVAIFTHQFQLLWVPDCEYPKGFMVWIGLHGIMFLFLFSDFYKQNYIEKQKRLKETKRRESNGKVPVDNKNQVRSDVDDFIFWDEQYNNRKQIRQKKNSSN